MNETKSKDEDLSLRSINISDHDDPKMTDNGLTIKKNDELIKDQQEDPIQKLYWNGKPKWQAILI